MSKQGLKGYFQYGVEIPWDGSNALPTMMLSDCQVEVSFILGANGRKESGNAGRFNCMMIKSYKVIDDRYKPAEPEPAPAKSWFEAGEFPPVGIECEAKHENLRDGEWFGVEILKHRVNDTGTKVAASMSLDDRHLHWLSKFRPIRTGREKTIEAAVEAMQPNSLTGTMTLWFGKLYDAGLLRLPDQK